VGIVAPGNVADHGGVAAEAVVFAAGERFPDEQAAVAVAGGKQHAIRAVFHRGDPVRVLLELANHAAISGRIDADEPRRAADGDLRLVGGDVGGENRIAFDADFDDLFAGLDFVKDGLAGLPAAAAGDQ